MHEDHARIQPDAAVLVEHLWLHLILNPRQDLAAVPGAGLPQCARQVTGEVDAKRGLVVLQGPIDQYPTDRQQGLHAAHAGVHDGGHHVPA